MSTVDRGLLPPELRGLRTFKVYQSTVSRCALRSIRTAARPIYKALNRLSKTVADLLESMGREDPRHHDTPLPQRSGLAVYVAETTAELEGARAGLCDDAEKSARTRTDIRRMLAASRGTDGSNPVPSSGESASRGIFALPRREAGFSRGCVGPAGAARSAETGIARCMAPTGGNISVGPNSSTGVDEAVA